MSPADPPRSALPCRRRCCMARCPAPGAAPPAMSAGNPRPPPSRGPSPSPRPGPAQSTHSRIPSPGSGRLRPCRSAGAGSGRSRWSRDRPRPSTESEMSKKKTHRPCSHLPFRLHITYRIPDPADAVKPPARPLQGGSFLPAGAPFRQQETQIVCFFHSPGV